MIGETRHDHKEDVVSAECFLIENGTREFVVLRYMNDRYHLHIKSSNQDRVTLTLNTYDASNILNVMSDGTWPYSRCPACTGKP